MMTFVYKNCTFFKRNLTFTQILIFIMKEGKVKFFNESKGFGFIKDKSSNEEYFVHVSGLIDKIKEDDEVSFELQQGKKGLNAVNVKLL
jgi:cold shock protein